MNFSSRLVQNRQPRGCARLLGNPGVDEIIYKSLFFLLFTFCFLIFPSSCFAFSIGDVSQSEITSPNQVISVVLDLTDIPANESYFRVAFTESSTSRSYFGKMKNDKENWVAIGSLGECTNYYYLEKPDPTSNLTIQVQFNSDKDPGDYYLKAHRLTKGCSTGCISGCFPVSYTYANANSPSPSPKFSSSPSPSPEISSAFYKINQPKDEEGNDISSVKVYVDNIYVHHYAPEELEFCDGCSCDGYVACGFGKHKISLQKNSYQEWSEEREINREGDYQVNPVLAKQTEEESETEESNPSPSTSPLLTTPSLTTSSLEEEETVGTGEGGKEEMGADFTGEVLGEEEKKEKEEKEEKKFKLSLPLVIILTGLLFLTAASFPFLRPKLVKLLEKLRKSSTPGLRPPVR